jgi:hypothetical protein
MSLRTPGSTVCRVCRIFQAVGAQSYERTSSAHQQRRSGEIGRPKGPKKRREKQPGIHKEQVKHFDEFFADNRLQLYSNDSFFVFLAVDLGDPDPVPPREANAFAPQTLSEQAGHATGHEASQCGRIKGPEAQPCQILCPGRRQS